MREFQYKILAPPLAALLIHRPRRVAYILRKTGLELLLKILTVLAFRRLAVAGTNLFSPDLYHILHQNAPRGFFRALVYHFRQGEQAELNPTYLFHSAWFKSVYADLMPPDVSPLIFFLLRQKKNRLRPHWQTIFIDYERRFFQVLITGADRRLAVSPWLKLDDHWRPTVETRLRSLRDEPANDFGWLEINLDQAQRVCDYLWDSGGDVEPVHQARPYRLAPLKGVFGNDGQKILDLVKIGYSSYLARLNGILAIGAETALLTRDSTICRDGDPDCPSQSKYYAHDLMVRRHLPRRRLAAWRLKKLVTLDRGLLLMGRSDLNYWHWLVETLPRVVPVLDRINDGDLKDYPLVISRGMPVTHEQSLKVLAPNKPLIHIDRQMAFVVNDAVYLSEINRYYSHPAESVRSEPHEALRNYDIRLDIPIMRTLRSRILAAAEHLLGSGPVKLLVDRQGPRSLANRAVIRRLAEDHGFIVIHPASMSFLEQVAVFNRASHILLCSGAECANIMFTKPGTAVGVIMPQGLRLSYSLWQAQASCAEADFYLLYGERAYTDLEPLQDQMVLPPSRLASFFARVQA